MELIIFDVDGTLVKDYTGTEPLPGVREWFDRHAHEQKIAIASNQGGVGLRYWMESENFGTPEKYPTEHDVYRRLNQIYARLNYIPAIELVCFAYMSQKGLWSPAPEDAGPQWNPFWRKPAPGMLNAAMLRAGVNPDLTLMVGDRDEDHIAAEQAGCDFMPASEFFKNES